MRGPGPLAACQQPPGLRRPDWQLPNPPGAQHPWTRSRCWPCPRSSARVWPTPGLGPAPALQPPLESAAVLRLCILTGWHLTPTAPAAGAKGLERLSRPHVLFSDWLQGLGPSGAPCGPTLTACAVQAIVAACALLLLLGSGQRAQTCLNAQAAARCRQFSASACAGGVRLPEPPCTDPSEAAQLSWLHSLALHLDPVLSLPELVLPWEPHEASLSAAACFQALLVHAAPAIVKVRPLLVGLLPPLRRCAAAPGTAGKQACPAHPGPCGVICVSAQRAGGVGMSCRRAHAELNGSNLRRGTMPRWQPGSGTLPGRPSCRPSLPSSSWPRCSRPGL